MMFTESDYATLHSLIFRDEYPGYRPTVKEIPNGDGHVDAAKRYAHVADKYLNQLPPGWPGESYLDVRKYIRRELFGETP